MIIHFFATMSVQNIVKIPAVSARRLITVTKTAPGNETELLSTYLLFINLYFFCQESAGLKEKKLQNVLIDINSINNVTLCQTFNYTKRVYNSYDDRSTIFSFQPVGSHKWPLLSRLWVSGGDACPVWDMIGRLKWVTPTLSVTLKYSQLKVLELTAQKKGSELKIEAYVAHFL